MIEVQGKLEGVALPYSQDCLMHGVVVNGAPRWSVLDLAKIVFAPLGIDAEEFVEMLTNYIEPDEVFLCELKGSPLPFLVVSYEQIECFLIESNVEYGDFLVWLEKVDRQTQDRTMSDGDDYLEGYMTSDYAALVRQILTNLGYTQVR